MMREQDSPVASAAGSKQERSGSRGVAIRLLAIVALYAAATLIRLYGQEAIHNLDFWYHVSLGERLAWQDPATWIDGLYPVGYPFLLRLGLTSGLDVLRVGQFLSWSGGLLAIVAGFLLIVALTRRPNLAAAGMLLLLLNGHFFTYATTEGNDMLAAGLQACSMTLLWLGAELAVEKRAGRLLALSGLSLGLAYLVRYTALILLPVAVFYLLLRYWPHRKALTRTLAFFTLPFLLVTMVQWLPSWLLHDTPLYNQQAKNVWFGIYGEGDWVNNWNNVPDSISLLQVMAINPSRFARHWLQQLRLALDSQLLWPQMLYVLWLLALPALLLYRRYRLATRLLLVMVALVPLFVTALAWLAPRFLLLPLWIQAVLMSWLFFRLTDAPMLSQERRRLLAAGFLAVLAVGLQVQPFTTVLTAPPLRRPQEVHAFMRQAGMQDAARVATNDPYLHATDEDRRTRYAQAYMVNANPDTVAGILELPGAASWQYLVLDYVHGFGAYESLRDPLRQARVRLAPLQLSQNRDIYCLLPCAMERAAEADLQFANGMTLAGFRLTGASREGGLYLYWQAGAPLERSYKISVRIQDSQGADIWQVDGIPQRWTYPTTSWQLQQVVVDFYPWRLEDECPVCTLALVVYDEQTLEPIAALTPSGSEVGPVIALTTLNAAAPGP